MRPLFSLCIAAVMLLGCTKDLEKRLDQLQNDMEVFRSGINILKRAVDDELTVQALTTITGGHKLVMSDDSHIYLYDANDERVADREGGVFYNNVDLDTVEGCSIIIIETVDGSVYELLIIPKEEEDTPVCPGHDDEPWQGYLDPDVYDAQDIINLTNVLRANISSHNLATAHIMEIAYNFWKRRGEFIYCADTALDKPWNYWSYVGYRDGNTGFTVGEGHGGYKRIDCSTFVRYVVNGIDYYSTPYYNALEWTEVTQGALNSSGANATSTDVKVCRSGKMYLRTGKKYVLEKASSSYSFTKVLTYNSSGKVVRNLSGATSFVFGENESYIRVEMKVSSANNYAPAVEGVSPAAILKCLRIREDERLPVNAEIPLEGLRSTFQICPWLDENGYGLEAYKDYNPLSWEDSDFLPGTIIFMGQDNNSRYKGITHIVLYIGSGYIIHSQGARGLLGGEGIMIDKLRDMEYRYTRPFCSAAVVKYHTDFSEEKSRLGL